MPEFVLHTGSMDCGKSTPTLQLDHTQPTYGRQGWVFTSRDRLGGTRTSSRLGLETSVTEVGEEFDFWAHIIAQLVTGRWIDYLVCDETQFYMGEQVEQLVQVVDELQIDIYTLGILVNSRTKLLPRSQRLAELADRVETLPIGPLCWCGAKGARNACTINGLMVTEGFQMVVGDTGAGEVRYEVLYRAYYRRRMTATRARVTLGEDPLPFGE